MHALTRNQTWRDIGAAAGPLLAGFLLGVMTAQTLHLIMLGLFAASSGWFFLGGDFIAVTKQETAEWFALKPSVLAAIMEHYASGLPVLDKPASPEAEADGDEDDTVQQIKHLLDTRVRPAVAMDGGDIVFHSFEDGVVTLEMRGACSGCPSSTATLKMGIENMLRHYIPEVQEVRPAEF